MAFIIPTVQDFKDIFIRDFVYGPASNQITDPDIQRGIDDAKIFINETLFGDQTTYDRGFLLLSAHSMVMNLRCSSQGTAGKFNYMQSSKSVGGISESFAIPQRILDNPEYAYLNTTRYGAKFLFMILPQLSGQIFTVQGKTRA